MRICAGTHYQKSAMVCQVVLRVGRLGFILGVKLEILITGWLGKQGRLIGTR